MHASNVALVEMDNSKMSESNGGSINLTFLREISNGPCDMKNEYGIIMGEVCGFPLDVLGDAREFKSLLKGKYPIVIQSDPLLAGEINLLCHYLNQLLLLKTSSAMETEKLLTHLSQIQSAVDPDIASTLLEVIHDFEKSLQNCTNDENTTVS